jgi:hypothetical protein
MTAARRAILGRATGTGVRVVLAAALLLCGAWTFPIVVWQDQTPDGWRTLHANGVTAGRVLRPWNRPALPAGLSWYCENVATDFYAAYHRWQPGRPVNVAFGEVQALARARDPRAFMRDPSLSDPLWLARIERRLQDVAPGCPLFVDLADESGIADLAAPWDFDFSPQSLAAFRAWLRRRYGTIAALNAAWGTHVADFAELVPPLTDTALRDDRAVPGWMEFKAFMDSAFADAVRAGAAAVHRGGAPAGLEGAQPPGWGGYDYGRLAGTVDVMEIYDAGNAVEIARALNPALHVLITSALFDPAERARLWHEFLLGIDGVVLWDDPPGLLRGDGSLAPRGAEELALLRLFAGPLGQRLRGAAPVRGDIAILYDQPSFRLQWLLDRRAARTDWMARDAQAEFATDNPWRAATRRAAAALAALGVQPRWVTPDALPGLRAAALLLPDSIALSDADVAAIRQFAASGGLVLADRPPGTHDALGHTRATPAAYATAAALRRDDPTSADLADLAGLLARHGFVPPVRVLGPDGAPPPGIDIRLFREKGGVLIGIQRLSGAAGPVTLRSAGRITVLHGPAPDTHGILPLGAEPTVLAVR